MNYAVNPAVRALLLFVACIGFSAVADAQQKIKPVKISDSVYMFMGRGGNVAVCFGEEGTFVVDSQFATETGAIRSALKKITEAPIRFLINTHWHGDHVGGNSNFASLGAIIVAHKNVRERMSKKQFMKAFGREVEASAAQALPLVTFTTDMMLHLNGEDVHITHVAPAHTDGDAFVYFKKSNVLHMGDTFFKGRYPFIDVSSGGHLAGILAAVDTALALTDTETAIIPGHGELATRADLLLYKKTLTNCHDAIRKLVEGGATDDQVVAAKPTAKFDAEWGQGFMKPEKWTRIVCDGLRNAHTQGGSVGASYCAHTTFHKRQFVLPPFLDNV